MWHDGLSDQLAEMLKDMVRLNTVNPPGNERLMTDYIADKLNKAGIEYQIYEKEDGRSNIIAKITGTKQNSKLPVLIISHTDVVEAGSGWTQNPFSGDEIDGTIFGRGTLDTKQLTAVGLLALIKIAESSEKPQTDIVYIATADEENGSSYGMEYITQEYSSEIPFGYVLNEGGGFVIELPDRKLRTLSCGEKGFCKMRISILPDSKNDWENLQKLLERLSSYQSDFVETPVSKAFLEACGGVIPEDKTLKDLWEYTTLHNLMVNSFEFDKEKLSAPEIEINFKFIGEKSQDELYDAVVNLLEGLPTEIEVLKFQQGFISSLDNDFVTLLDKYSKKHDSGSVLLPMLALGNTDGRFLRSNVYGYTPLLSDIPFSTVLKKVHQADECITRDSLTFCGKVALESLFEYLFDEREDIIG